VRRSVVVLIIVAIVLALSIGTALAENKPADKGGDKGPGQQQGASKTNAAQGQQGQAANKVSAAKKSQETTTGDDTSYGFKGTVAQNGADGSSLEVKVEKANDDARSFVGKNFSFNVSSDTEIYRDDATNTQSSDLDAKLSDLKQGDKVLIQAKAPKNATSFTASLISAEASDANSTDTKDTTAPLKADAENIKTRA
jgi:hypothetical protein